MARQGEGVHFLQGLGESSDSLNKGSDRKGQIWDNTRGGTFRAYGLDVDMTQRQEENSQVFCTKDPVWDGSTCQHGENLGSPRGVGKS